MGQPNPVIQLGVGGIVFRNDCILLVCRKNPPNAGQWAIPGGKVHYGEALQEAVARELAEETGIVVQAGEPVYTFEVINTTEGEACHYVVIDYDAEYIRGEIQANDDALDAAWVSRARFSTLPVNPITTQLLKDKYHFP